MSTSGSTHQYKTVLTIVLGFLILGYFSHSKILQYSGFTIGVLAVSSSFLCNIIVLSWEKLGFVLGWINTRVLLSLIYFVILVPLAFFKKLFSKKEQEMKSQYITRNITYVANDFVNKW